LYFAPRRIEAKYLAHLQSELDFRQYRFVKKYKYVLLMIRNI
jgi:hypothetical protein